MKLKLSNLVAYCAHSLQRDFWPFFSETLPNQKKPLKVLPSQSHEVLAHVAIPQKSFFIPYYFCSSSPSFKFFSRKSYLFLNLDSLFIITLIYHRLWQTMTRLQQTLRGWFCERVRCTTIVFAD